MSKPAWTCPMFLPGKEPLPAGFTEDDRATLTQTQEWTHIMQAAMESCAFKCGMSGIAGFGLGGFFALLSASLTVDDPMRRSNLQAAAVASHGPGYSAPPEPTTMQQTKVYFKETGRNMYRSAKGFGKVGALYSGIECCIEGVSISASKRIRKPQLTLPRCLCASSIARRMISSTPCWLGFYRAAFWRAMPALKLLSAVVLHLQPFQAQLTGTCGNPLQSKNDRASEHT